MDFSINPNSHYLKLMFIVKSAETPGQLEVAQRCLDLYDSRRDYYIQYFKKSGDKPIVAHTGEYDHETAMWILSKKLKLKLHKYDK